MVTVIRPSRARCVKETIPRHERAVFTFKEGRMPASTTTSRRQLFANAAIRGLARRPVAVRRCAVVLVLAESERPHPWRAYRRGVHLHDAANGSVATGHGTQTREVGLRNRDLARIIHNADARFLDRHVESSKIVQAALLLLMLEAAYADLVSPSA